MALRNLDLFEGAEDAATATATVDTDISDMQATAQYFGPQADAAAAKSASTSVAAAAKTAVGAAMKFKPALTQFENVIDPTGMEFGVFPKITVNLGGFKTEDDGLAVGKKLGKDITIKMLSWNRRWLASPGSQDKESKEYVKYSTDGVFIQGTNQKLVDYVQQLIDVEGYKEASIKEYFAIWGFLTEANGKVIDPAEQQMVELQCSPQSVGQFKRHQIEHGMKVSQGLAPESDILKCHANEKNFNGNDFGYASFSAG